MTFEDELRDALAVDDRPVNQLGAARYAYAMSHQKTHTSVIEDAAALLLEILPELRELVWQPIETAPKNGELFLVRLPRMMDLVVRCRFETVHKQWLSDRGTDDGGITKMEYFHAGDLWMPIPTTTLTEKLKKAGLI